MLASGSISEPSEAQATTTSRRGLAASLVGRRRRLLRAQCRPGRRHERYRSLIERLGLRR